MGSEREARGSCASEKPGFQIREVGPLPRTSWTDFPAWPFSPPPNPEGFGSSEVTSSVAYHMKCGQLPVLYRVPKKNW
ncbi:hypothetical protein NN561_005641 [Cricetulus griseus]